MLRIKWAMAVAALVLLQYPLSVAAEGDHRAVPAPSTASIGVSPEGGEVRRIAASTIQGESDQLGRSDSAGRQEQAQVEPASARVTMEYPALALLAMAIISMAALSRRDSLRIDR